MTVRANIKGLDAARIRALLGGSGSEMADDLAECVPQHLDVDVIVTDLTGNGYLMTIGNRAVVVVERTEGWFRQNFTIAHELGHLAQDTLCVGHLNASSGDEARANRFAADLLMPEDEVRSMDWEGITMPALAAQVWSWGVSTEALSTRLDSLGVTARPEIQTALSQPTRGLLRRYLQRDPGRDVITSRSARAVRRRFPVELISRLEDAVESGRAPVGSLAFAQGVDVSKLENHGVIPTDVDEDLHLLDGLE